jgi:hypothetical protein
VLTFRLTVEYANDLAIDPRDEADRIAVLLGDDHDIDDVQVELMKEPIEQHA